jgi:hypothetical protein
MIGRTPADRASASEPVGGGVWGRSPQRRKAFAEKRKANWSNR